MLKSEPYLSTMNLYQVRATTTTQEYCARKILLEKLAFHRLEQLKFPCTLQYLKFVKSDKN